ncbi:MAG: hypothetical protein A2451_01875 [Bdellovibrionales bacterium RIFOXYC2_FULL_39_8]|nr:MAG: hypothetical protein A2451_01875 [Bdellovibrionales bacterium RIFOXYC2_FULL_39_8]
MLMMAFANFDPAQSAQTAEEIAKTILKGNPKTIKDPNSNPSISITNVKQALESMPDVTAAIEVSQKEKEIKLTLKDKYFFASGSAQLIPSAESILQKLVSTIVKESKEFSLVIEGHTDDVPISQTGRLKEYFRSNWELSAARAAMVARKFDEAGHYTDKIRPIGYADSRPLAPNRDVRGNPNLSNMAKNRRVVIRVGEPVPKGFKMGLGLIYQSDTQRPSEDVDIDTDIDTNMNTNTNATTNNINLNTNHSGSGQ